MSRLAPDARERDTDEVMSGGQLANEVKTLIGAGHETMASTLNWIWYFLSQHPDVEARLSNELERQMVSDIPVWTELQQFTYTRK